MAGFSRADDNAAPVPGSKILVVAARFNDNIVSLLREGALAALERLGAKATLIEVPGALEIAPAIAIALDVAQKAGAPYDGVVALGCVIRGETYHFELVSNESGAGITRVGLDAGIPIANAVLTTENDEQAEARMAVKGADAARVAVEMANLALALDELAQVPDEE